MFKLNRVKKSIKVKLIISFFLALLMIGSVSYLSYGSLSGLIKVIQEEAVPDKQLIILRGIQSDLADAESSVRTYTLTKNEKYLDPYYISVGSISEKLNKLKMAYEEGSPEVIIVDSIETLIARKYDVMDQLIHVDNRKDVNKVIDRISNKIKNVDVDYDVEESEEENKVESREKKEASSKEEEKDFFKKLFSGNSDKEKEKVEEKVKSEGEEDSGFLGGLFSGNKKEEERKKEVDESQTKKENKTEEATAQKEGKNPGEKQIEQKISTIQEEERRKLRKQEQQEMVLTQMDQQIMSTLRKLFQVMETQALKNSQIKARKAASSAIITKNIITGLTIGGLFLLLALLYVIIGDVAKNSRYRKILKIAKDKALKLARVKEDFLANISHEIRTPMNAIVGYSQLLKNTPLNEKQQQYLKTIDNSSKHLNAIVNDVLDYSKLESGKLNFEIIGYQPRKVLKEIYHSLKESAKSKGLLFKLNIDDNVPEVLIGDPVRLKQILYNVVGNAIKFTESGEVKIKCSMANKSNMKIVVADTGVGISEKMKKTIFKDFYQEDSSTTRRFGGTGLGLAITQKLVKLQDGDIHLESEKGKGTEFTIEIPYAVGDKSDLPVRKKEKYSYEALKEKKILIADDDQYNRSLIENIMKKWGVDIILAEDGEKAIEIARKVKFDAYLIDLHMPNMNGLEVAKIMRKELGIEKPIIALTAAASKKDADNCIEAGMDTSISKPFRISDLYASLLKYMGLESLEQKGSEGTNGSNGNGHSKVSLDELKDIAAGDDDFMVRMIRVFIESSEQSSYRMKNALKDEDWDTIRKTAHKISPSAKQLGMRRIAKKLKAIEDKIIKDEISPDLYHMVKTSCEELDDLVPELENEIENLKK